MIGILSSGSPEEDYILECLWDVGLRTFVSAVGKSNGSSRSKLLLVTKENLTESEIRKVLDFANNDGDVLILCPCSRLFDVFGGWNTVEGSSGLTPNDYLSTRSVSIPIFEPIHSTEAEAAIRTDKRDLPLLVSIEQKNIIQFFSFSVSRNIFKIKQGCFGEGYISERKELGGFAHIQMNPLEISNGPVHVAPCADVLSYLVLERILMLLARRGICLPFLWTIPHGKDASILMTMDEDWASPVVTKNALGVFISKRVPLTLFLTTPFDGHVSLPKDDLVEYSIHPFHKNDVFSTEILEEAMAFLSQLPTGFRNHRRLVEKPGMYASAKDLGLQWNSNLGVSKSTGYSHGTGFPFKIIHENTRFDILEFPINFEDDVHFTTCSELGFDGSHILAILEKNMDSFHSYFVLGFHPIHVFLNSSSAEEYNEAKNQGVLEEDGRLISLRESLSGKEGTGMMLRRILEFVNSNKSRLHVGTLGGVNEFWRKRADTRIDYDYDGFKIAPVFEGLGVAFPFLDKRAVEKSLGIETSREVDVVGIPSTLVEPPPEATAGGLWKIPHINHPNP